MLQFIAAAKFNIASKVFRTMDASALVENVLLENGSYMKTERNERIAT